MVFRHSARLSCLLAFRSSLSLGGNGAPPSTAVIPLWIDLVSRPSHHLFFCISTKRAPTTSHWQSGILALNHTPNPVFHLHRGSLSFAGVHQDSTSKHPVIIHPYLPPWHRRHAPRCYHSPPKWSTGYRSPAILVNKPARSDKRPKQNRQFRSAMLIISYNRQ